MGQDSWQAKTAQNLQTMKHRRQRLPCHGRCLKLRRGAPPSEADGPTTSGREHAVGSPAALSPDLVTLALLPRSQWQGLVHLDAIKVRAKIIPLCLCSVRVQLPYSCTLKQCVLPVLQ